MKKQKVISIKYLPSRWPVQLTAVVYLLVDKFHPSDFITGLVVAVMVLLWVTVLYQKTWVEEYDEPLFGANYRGVR